MHKKHVRIKETPYEYTFMHKRHVRIKETPYGYTSMHKKHVQTKERRSVDEYREERKAIIGAGLFFCRYGFWILQCTY